jgi:hypothetical protein
VQINKAMVGFLTQTGYSHGGNGFGGMAFLLDQFKDSGLADPTDPHHGIDLEAMAVEFARSYKREKAASRESGASGPRALPGVHHALLLALLWKDYKSGALSERELETAAFTVFLYGRMIGCAAEIDDHLNRGRNMDTRTPAAQCSFVC